MSSLSADQRWLLLHMGSWQIVHALCSPEGVTKLMQSCWGSTGGRCDYLDNAPAWLQNCGWDTYGGVITARTQSGPQIKIKAAEINRYASQLPADIKAELIECRNAGTANAVLRGRFCYCGRHDKTYPNEKDRICPPSPEQESQATADYWRIRALEYVVLAKALGLNASFLCEEGQLELFEVTA